MLRIKKRIEMSDSQPGFSKREEKLYDELRKDLEIIQTFIAKEVEDIEEELE